MNIITKIVCRTVGAAGLGVALYDAAKVGALYSRNQSEIEQAKYLEDRFFSSRTLDDVSYSSNAIRQKTFDVMSKNPLPSVWGATKGGVGGFLNSLGDNLPLVICSSMALLGKGIMAKLGTVGIALGACYKVAREGLGLGKNSPMR